MSHIAGTTQQRYDFAVVCSRYRTLPAELRAKIARIIIEDMLRGISAVIGFLGTGRSLDIEPQPIQVSLLLALARLASPEDIASQLRVLRAELEEHYQTIERDIQANKVEYEREVPGHGPSNAEQWEKGSELRHQRLNHDIAASRVGRKVTWLEKMARVLSKEAVED